MPPTPPLEKIARLPVPEDLRKIAEWLRLLERHRRDDLTADEGYGLVVSSIHVQAVADWLEDRVP